MGGVWFLKCLVQGAQPDVLFMTDSAFKKGLIFGSSGRNVIPVLARRK
jgi:hypothetical protein